VVDLVDHRHPAALQALDDVKLPERLAKVELAGEDPGRVLAERSVVTRFGEGRAPDVVAEIEIGIVHPDRMRQVEWRPHHLLAVARNQVQPFGYGFGDAERAPATFDL